MTKPKSKEFTERDLHTQLQWGVMSWSMISSWQYDPEQWYKSYYLGIRQPPNKLMQIGIDVGDRLITDPTFLPTLERPDMFEKNLSAVIGNVKITGHIDGWFKNGIDEYKTSLNKNRWDQKKVDEHGQLDFYCLLRYIHEKIRPEDLRLRLWSIPIIEFGDFSWEAQTPVCFNTKRTFTQVLKFGAYIKQVHKDMTDYIKSHEKID